jgi:hypothetical protein
MTFDYTNYAPPAATDREGRRMRSTNRIVLSRDEEGRVVYRRFYKRGSRVSKHGIGETFPRTASATKIALQIHWGCCGWSANYLQVGSLADRVEEFLNEEC